MAVVQSTYNQTIAPAVAGMVANQRTWDAITRNCETADGIGFGLAVGIGDNDSEKNCKLGGALADFMGVSLRDVTNDTNVVPDEYAENDNVGILTEGEIWVQVSGAPGPDDPVHYNATTGVFAASGGSGPVVGARFTAETTNGLCRLKLGGAPQAAA